MVAIKYDYIFTGTGVAAITLLTEILNSPLKDSKILLLDKQDKPSRNLTLCYWEEGSSLFENLNTKTFDRINFTDKNFSKTSKLKKYKYKCLNADKLHAHLQQLLSSHKNITFQKARVEEIKNIGEKVAVSTSNQTYYAQYVFDSRFDIHSFNPMGAIYLQQHFRGWFIKTERGRFDPHTMNLFDLRINQTDDFRFVYLIPFSPNEALIELVTLKPTDFDSVLKEYVTNALELKDFQITGYESGVNPLTTFDFRHEQDSRIIKIGVAGGQIKPSSGYAFTRMQKDAGNIVKALIKNGSPAYSQKSSWFYRSCDFLLLKLLQDKPFLGQKIFAGMFKHNNAELVFKFLDERASIWHKLRMMVSMYPWVFIKLSLRVVISKSRGTE